MVRASARIRPLLAAAAALLAVAIVLATTWSASPRMNVILLVMDTTRADRCSFLGYDRPTTPRLAEFAKDAVAFSQAWSPAGWTAPAHASLFTGLRPEHHAFEAGTRSYLGPEFPTLAERFSEAGYATACFTNNTAISPSLGLTRGFQTVEPLYRDEARPYPWAPATHERALEWAAEARRAGKPFFLFVNDMEPHMPYTPPLAMTGTFLRGDPTAEEVAAARAFNTPHSLAFDAGAEKLSERQLALLSDLYDGEIATLDEAIGDFLDRLRGAGMFERTLVVICGDHGENLGEHGMVEHTFSLHRTIGHVPLLVRLPGRFDGGRRVDDLVRLEDVPPTILEACGLPPLPNADGVSLGHDLGGRVSRAVLRAFDQLVDEMKEKYPSCDCERFRASLRGAFDGRFHLIASSDGREELYDVTADPAEGRNLAATEPQTAARLRELLPDER